MWENLIGQHIRRANRNLLITNLILLAVVAVSLMAAHRYLYNVFAGPFPIANSDLMHVASANDLSHYYVSIKDVAPKDTGLQAVERTRNRYSREVTSEKITATYYFADLGGKFVLIKSPESSPVSSYTGALQEVPSELRSRIQSGILDPSNLKFEDTFVPLMVDATDFKTGAWVGLAIGIPLLLLAVYNILKTVKRSGNLDSSPIAKYLSKRYNQPAAVVAQAIDQDFKNSNSVTPLGRVQVSTNWLLRLSAFRVDVVALNEIVWVYQKVVKHSYNFIPTGKTYAIVIRDRFGGLISVDAGRGKGKDRVAGFFQLITSRVPWVIAGFSLDLKKLYDKNRAQFVAMVDQRRGQAGAARA